jgi:hypothetical protein
LGGIAIIHPPGVYPDEGAVFKLFLAELWRNSTFIDREQEFRKHAGDYF